MKSERALISSFLSNYEDQPAVQGKVLDILILIGLNYDSSHLTKTDLLYMHVEGLVDETNIIELEKLCTRPE